MYLIPFGLKIKKGVNDVIAFGNVMPMAENLLLHRVELFSDLPVEVRLLGVREEDISGTDISDSAVDADLGENSPIMYVGVTKNPTVAQDFILLKISNGGVVCDEKDAITLPTQTWVVIRITATEDGKVLGNILLEKPDKKG